MLLRRHRRAPALRAHTRVGCALLALCCAAAAAETRDSETDAELRLAQVAEAVAEAHFPAALALAEDTRARLDRLEASGAQGVARRTRLEVLAATAEVALGRNLDARACLVRALRADPGLVLDESNASPKLTRLMPEARRLAARAEGGL